MLQKRQRAASAIALLLVFSLSQFYVQANLSGSSLVENAATSPASKTGRLTTHGNNPITLNGNLTPSGTTVLSGSQLQTPAGVGASVQVGRLGFLSLDPETSLVLNFDDSSIDVTLSSGHATLTTNEGFNGSITTPDGETERTGPAGLSTIIGQTALTEDDGDTPLVETAEAAGPVQASEAARRACLRAAEEEFRKAMRAAQENFNRAKSEAEAEYRAAMRAATSDAQRQAARAARRDALRAAQDERRRAMRAAQTDKLEARRACANPSTQTASSDPPPRINFKGVGLLGSLSNDAARAFGLVVWGGAIASSLIIVNLDGDDRGVNPSPSNP